MPYVNLKDEICMRGKCKKIAEVKMIVIYSGTQINVCKEHLIDIANRLEE